MTKVEYSWFCYRLALAFGGTEGAVWFLKTAQEFEMTEKEMIFIVDWMFEGLDKLLDNIRHI